MSLAARFRLTPRRAAVALTIAATLVLLACSLAGADVFGNVGPASQLPGGGIAGRFPIGNYALDSHFSAVKAGVFSGIDVSGVPPMIAWFLANSLWQLTAFVANALITLFVFAFSLDLVNGSATTGGQGALAPVSQAVSSIYAHTLGAPWMTLAITAAGVWAMWKALVQRRYVETAGALAISLACCLLALFLVTQPQRTIGAASRVTNEVSAGMLSLTSKGEVGDQSAAKQAAADQLFSLLVQDPWTVLEFGGIEHCVKSPPAEDPVSVAVQPLSPDPAQSAALFQQLRAGTEIQAPAKTCVNDENKYAPRFLQYQPDSDDRNDEYAALEAGDTGKLPSSDPAKQHPEQAHYPLGNADKPAADASDKGGQYQRLLMAVIVFTGELGCWLLLGSLSIGVVLAQVLALLLLGFAPVALVVGIYPGRGHQFFFGWFGRLVSFVIRKAVYSLILAVLLAVAAAVADASVSLGWLMSWGLQAAFFWSVCLFRNDITRALTVAVGGSPEGAPNPAGLRRFALTYLGSLYTAARVAQPVGALARRPFDDGRRSSRRARRLATAAAGASGWTPPPTAGGESVVPEPTPTKPSGGTRPEPPEDGARTDHQEPPSRETTDAAPDSSVDQRDSEPAVPVVAPSRAEQLEGPWPPVRRRSRRGRRPIQTATESAATNPPDSTTRDRPRPGEQQTPASRTDAPPMPQEPGRRGRASAAPARTGGPETRSDEPVRGPGGQAGSLRDALHADEQRFPSHPSATHDSNASPPPRTGDADDRPQPRETPDVDRRRR